MDKDRVVVVTGAASGIGLGIAKLFAQNGHPVAMLDMQDGALERESAALKAAGGRVLPCKVDVAKRDQIESAYAAVREALGPIAIVIANAGVSERADVLTMSAETWQRTIDINLTGAFHTIQPALPDMITMKWGRIVTISSHAALSGAPDQVHYSASKGGVISMTRALARALATHGITVNTIPPTLVDTPAAHRDDKEGEPRFIDMIIPMIPIARAGTPEDIANACEFLCSDKASYITGQQINVNGGVLM